MQRVLPLMKIPSQKGACGLTAEMREFDWANILTTNGLAHGESLPLFVREKRVEQGDEIDTPVGDYNDPTAILTGSWGRNQHAKGRIFSRHQTPEYYHEVELRLRSSLNPHGIPGYEVFFRCLKGEGGYAEIVRWEGPLGSFTSLCRKNGPEFGVADGDLIEATIIGNVIRGYINGREVTRAVDDAYATGNPGIGFNYGGESTYKDHGFTYYEVQTWDD